MFLTMKKGFPVISGKIIKDTISLAIVASFVLSPAPYADAYIGCEPVASGIRAVRTDDNYITYHNTSPYCVFVGLVMYKLTSPDATKREFHYATMRGLPGGESMAIGMPIPPCAYLVDVIVGEPIKDAKVASAYGNRLLFEYVMADHSTPYCESATLGSGSYVTTASQNNTLSGASGNSAAVPLPSPRGVLVPLPSPKPIVTPTPTPVPLPSPTVLGSATSTGPLAANTGGDATVPLALLGSMAVSGASWYISRRQVHVSKRVQKLVG